MKITDFAGVDSALKRLCELEVELANKNGEVTLKCNEIKEAAKPEIERLDSEKNTSRRKSRAFARTIKASSRTNAAKTLLSAKSATKSAKA